MPPRQRRAPRRRRSLSGGRRRQGHRHLLRHRQRDLGRARFLAGRCLRLGRLGRLRPQEAWRSPRAAPGSASSGTSARWTSTSSASRSGWWAWATCPATCSATACCCPSTSSWWRPSITATSSSIPDPGAGALAERKRLFDLPRSSWQDYDKAKISRGGGVFSRGAKSIPLSEEIKALLGVEAANADAERADARDPQVPDRPPLVRRHRHLPARLHRDGRRGRRPRQRCPAHHGRRGAGQGDRRRRQPRRHPARAHRVRRARRAHQHRLHRQFGGREHLRPGGQHQDRAGAGDPVGQARCRRAQQAARRHDRGRRRRLAAQQLPAVAGAEPGRAQERGRACRLLGADAGAGGGRAARSHAGGVAERHGDAGARARRARPHPARACGAAELRQDRPAARPAGQRGAGRAASSSPGSPAISRRCCASALPAISPSTACAARSSRSGSPTPSSTAAARPWRCGWPTRRGAPAPMSPTRSWPRARCSSCRRCGSASMRSTARPRATRRSASIRRRGVS